MTALTDRQREVLDAIVAYTKASGYPPTLREIGCLVGIGTAKGVADHLDAIERKGYIVRKMGSPRAIRVVKAATGKEKAVSRTEEYRDLLELWVAWWNGPGRQGYRDPVIPPLADTAEALHCVVCCDVGDAELSDSEMERCLCCKRRLP